MNTTARVPVDIFRSGTVPFKFLSKVFSQILGGPCGIDCGSYVPSHRFLVNIKACVANWSAKIFSVACHERRFKIFLSG
eukprot:14996839-Ditylum_brightwellii.AAC.1